MNENIYQDLPDHTSEDMTRLENRIRELETELGTMILDLDETRKRLSELENQLPDSLIISPNFLKRSFAVFGHYFVANTLIALPIICLSIIAMILLLASFGVYSQ
jgi:hypothetical protein